MPSIFDCIYSISPVIIQNLGISLFGLIWQNRRFGGKFNQLVSYYQNRDHFSYTQWSEYQTNRLRALLSHSVSSVPYYRDMYKNVKGYPQFNVFQLSDLSCLPILYKENLRDTPSNFLVEDLNLRSIHYYHTSGTTGTPIEIGYTNEFQREWSAAYEVRVRNWAGVNRWMSRAMIGGRRVVPKAKGKPPFWRYNSVEHQLYMSAFHISPQNAKHYASALNQFQPDYLVGYASSHYFLARLFAEQNLKVHKPKAILTSSEKLTDDMRQTLEQVYQCQVFDAYSGVEACCLASECEKHRLHSSPDVGIIELVNERGQPVKPGEMGYIVATGLQNFTQPLIRFWTGDLALWDEETCECGRKMPILKELIGRLEDTVIGQDGRELVRFGGIFHRMPRIREGQIIQETFTDFRIRLVVDPTFNEEDRESVYKRFEERLGKINLTFEYVDQIERTQNGKFRAVISQVQRNTVTPAIK